MGESGSTAVKKKFSTVDMLSTLRQFFMFGLVGGSGTLVNLLVVYVVTRMLLSGAGLTPEDVVAGLPGTPWNIRWYHVIMTIAFLVANTWNYQLNRSWTFRGVTKRSWWRGFFPFLATGFFAFLVSQLAATLMMNPTSPVALPDEIFDNSTGLRTKFYWAAAISVIVAMPVNFVINKLWTFRKPKVVVVQERMPATQE
ncbi:hypothetical protein B841_05245 [Corynebacterium maris DSM 45190]|uniref:GtrA/DPMS transmembrane domain-containing protein n=1 Tax=Corynebacterium maris DSM 45190 TaxID=1224163 RepID=S5SU14_9CORY|nr:hypothetical protein B841_05245 [Corynebacterium maris DSM 45190]